MHAACLGTTFDLNDLITITQIPASSILLYLWHGEQHHLISKIDDGSPLPNDPMITNCSYKFLHDNIQESAYKLLNEDLINDTHWAIGCQLYEHYLPTPDALQFKLLTIINHLNIGTPNTITPNQQDMMISLNLQAAKKVKQQLSFTAMNHHLKLVINYLPNDHLIHPNQTVFDCYKQLIEAQYLCDEHDNLTKTFDAIRSSAFSSLDKADLSLVYLKQLTSLRKFEDAIAVGREGLSLMGIRLPRRPSTLMLVIEYIYLQWKTRHIDSVQFSTFDDRSERISLLLLSELAIIAHYIYDEALFGKSIFTMLKVSLKHTCTHLSASAFIGHGYMLCNNFGQHKKGDRFGAIACDLIKDSHDLGITLLMIKHVFTSHIHPWARPFSESLDLLTDCYQLAVRSGDPYWASFTLVNCNFFTPSIDDLYNDLTHQRDLFTAFKNTIANPSQWVLSIRISYLQSPIFSSIHWSKN